MKKLLLAATLMALAAPVSAKWIFNSSIDPMTDRTFSVTVSGEDNVGVNCSFSLFSFGKYMDSNGETAVIQARVDKNKPIIFTGEWRRSSAIVDHDELVSSGLLQQMKKGKRIVFRAYDYQDYNITKSSSLSGFTKAYNQLNCK